MASPAVAVARHQTQRFPTFVERYWRLFAEILFIIPAYAAYQLVRGTVGGQAGTAYDNASRVIHIEKKLGIFHEAFLQQLILPQAWAVDLFNYIYVWGHLPIIIGVAFWLYACHRHNYAFFRNAFMISGLIALIGFAAVPLAPPRYMPEFGFVDTIVSAQSYYVFQNPKIVNQYAAMPSLHFGWDLLAALAIFTHTRSKPLRVFATFMPLITLSGIVLTANHYFLDAVAGAAVAAMGVGIALVLHRIVPRDRFISFLT